MALIGTFIQTPNGFSGTINTLTLNIKASIVKIDTPSENGPDFRVMVGRAEIGAAWEKVAEGTGTIYLSVKLDDPSFHRPIHAALFAGEETVHNLVWSRPNT
jgi:uncharacterized protein (DUF736 family)